MRRILFVTFGLALAAGTAQARGWRERACPANYLPCAENNDCPGSAMCRDAGYDVKLCLDNEPTGAPCQFNSDCAGSGMCRQLDNGQHACLG